MVAVTVHFGVSGMVVLLVVLLAEYLTAWKVYSTAALMALDEAVRWVALMDI